MDKEQNRKFEEWYKRADSFHGLHDKVICEIAWQACLEANKVEEEEPEPSPTEMVKRLLEKGWTIEQGDDTQLTEWYRLRDPEKPHFTHTFSVKQVTEAYRKAFPSKKKIEIEVWTKNGKVRNILKEDVPYLEGWTKGIAIFWVEEEQPCSEDGSS